MDNPIEVQPNDTTGNPLLFCLAETSAAIDHPTINRSECQTSNVSLGDIVMRNGLSGRRFTSRRRSSGDIVGTRKNGISVPEDYKSSSDRGQSSFSNLDSDRSARIFPPVWQRGQ
jgi:hypothetical protein